MTTTTLSSNKSSEKLFDRKLFSMMAGCLRQNGILMAMYTVGLLLVTVLPTFYNLRQYTLSTRVNLNYLPTPSFTQ